jgi:predicted nucleotidyltransferase
METVDASDLPRWNQVPLAANDRAAILEAVSRLRAWFPVEEVVLFGSKCRGDADEESDVDLLVLTSRPTTRAERHAACDAVHSVQLAFDVVISLLIVSADEWRSGPLSVLPIRHEVEEQGVTVAA